MPDILSDAERQEILAMIEQDEAAPDFDMASLAPVDNRPELESIAKAVAKIQPTELKEVVKALQGMSLAIEQLQAIAKSISDSSRDIASVSKAVSALKIPHVDLSPVVIAINANTKAVNAMVTAKTTPRRLVEERSGVFRLELEAEDFH